MGAGTVEAVTAELPAEDPLDPQTIRRRLPAPARSQFLADYQAAVTAAHDPASYHKLRETLRTWATLAAAYGKPDLEDRAADVRAGHGGNMPLEQVAAGYYRAR
jgi:hypothetical protein